MTQSTEQCIMILSHPKVWAAARGLAQALLDRTTITGPDVEAMIRDMLGRPEDMRGLAEPGAAPNGRGM